MDDNDRFAILIAGSQFQDKSLVNLRCPENDVDGLNELLSSKEYGNFSECLVLKNLPYCEVLFKLFRLLKKAKRNDLVLIYYSGHGMINLAGKLHLLTKDTIVDMLDATSIPIEIIRNYLEVSKTNRVILILDCCYSGAVGITFTRVRGGVDNQLQLLANECRGIYIMTSSTAFQVALEKESENYGAFTKHFINGIREYQAANKEGNVTLDSLYSYILDGMLREGFQRPMKWDLGVIGDLILAGNSNLRVRNLDAPQLDSYSILDEKDPNVIMHIINIWGLKKDKRAVKPTIQALKNKDIIVRREAAKVLGLLGDIQAVEPLIQSLETSDRNLQRETIEALGKIGDARAVDSLIQVSFGKDIDVQRDIVKALAKIGDFKAISFFIQSLKDEDILIQDVSSTAIIKFGVSALESVAQALIKSDDRLRFHLKTILVKIGEPSTEPLITILQEENDDLKKIAAEALGEIGEGSVVSSLIQALKNRNESVRRVVFSAIIKIGKPAIEPLIQALDNECADIKREAVSALEKIRDYRAILPIIQALDDEDIEVRREAAKALGSFKDKRAVKPLIKILRDENANIRKEATLALKTISDSEAIEPLIQILLDEDIEVRKTAIEALGEFRDLRVIDPLIQASTEQRNQVVLSQIKAALIRMGKPAVDLLIKALDNKDEDTRVIITEVLGEIKDVMALDPLISAFTSYSMTERMEATSALIKIGKPAVDLLIKALKSNEPTVRANAAYALGRIGDSRALEPLRLAYNEEVNDEVWPYIDSALDDIYDALHSDEDDGDDDD